MQIKYTSTVIFVADIKASRQFYEGLLGMKAEADFGQNVGFAGGFALWENAHAHEIIFGRAPESSGPTGRSNVEVYFETEAIEEAWAKLAAAGVRAVHPIVEQPWAQRVFRVYDPDGHVVELGEPMPATVRRLLAQGMTAEAVAARTSMPLEFVQQVVQGAL